MLLLFTCVLLTSVYKIKCIRDRGIMMQLLMLLWILTQALEGLGARRTQGDEQFGNQILRWRKSTLRPKTKSVHKLKFSDVSQSVHRLWMTIRPKLSTKTMLSCFCCWISRNCPEHQFVPSCRSNSTQLSSMHKYAVVSVLRVCKTRQVSSCRLSTGSFSGSSRNTDCSTHSLPRKQRVVWCMLLHQITAVTDSDDYGSQLSFSNLLNSCKWFWKKCI